MRASRIDINVPECGCFQRRSDCLVGPVHNVRYGDDGYARLGAHRQRRMNRATRGIVTCEPPASAASRRRRARTVCNGWRGRSSLTRASPRRRSSSGGRRSWGREVAGAAGGRRRRRFRGQSFSPPTPRVPRWSRLAAGFPAGFWIRSAPTTSRTSWSRWYSRTWFRADALGYDGDPVREVALRDAGARRLLTPEELAQQDRRPDRLSMGPAWISNRLLGKTATARSHRVDTDRFLLLYGGIDSDGITERARRCHVGHGWCGQEACGDGRAVQWCMRDLYLCCRTKIGMPVCQHRTRMLRPVRT